MPTRGQRRMRSIDEDKCWFWSWTICFFGQHESISFHTVLIVRSSSSLDFDLMGVGCRRLIGAQVYRIYPLFPILFIIHWREVLFLLLCSFRRDDNIQLRWLIRYFGKQSWSQEYKREWVVTSFPSVIIPPWVADIGNNLFLCWSVTKKG